MKITISDLFEYAKKNYLFKEMRFIDYDIIASIDDFKTEINRFKLSEIELKIINDFIKEKDINGFLLMREKEPLGKLKQLEELIGHSVEIHKKSLSNNTFNEHTEIIIALLNEIKEVIKNENYNDYHIQVK